MFFSAGITFSPAGINLASPGMFNRVKLKKNQMNQKNCSVYAFDTFRWPIFCWLIFMGLVNNCQMIPHKKMDAYNVGRYLITGTPFLSKLLLVLLNSQRTKRKNTLPVNYLFVTFFMDDPKRQLNFLLFYCFFKAKIKYWQKNW